MTLENDYRKKVFAKRLKDIRESRSMSKARLARLSGTSGPKVCHYESGLCFPRVGTLYELADVLGVSIYDLLAE